MGKLFIVLYHAPTAARKAYAVGRMISPACAESAQGSYHCDGLGIGSLSGLHCEGNKTVNRKSAWNLSISGASMAGAERFEHADLQFILSYYILFRSVSYDFATYIYRFMLPNTVSF